MLPYALDLNIRPPSNQSINQSQTYEEVAALVRSVRDRGGKLRAVGAAHSWNSLYPENGTDAVILDNFKGVWQDPNDYTRVTVQGTFVCVVGGVLVRIRARAA